MGVLVGELGLLLACEVQERWIPAFRLRQGYGGHDAGMTLLR